MTPADTQAALDAATATLAAGGIPRASLHARDVVALVACVSALRDVLAQTERERDEARALAALVTTYRKACAAVEIADSRTLRLFDAPKREREQAEAARLVALRAHIAALAALRETPAGEGERC